MMGEVVWATQAHFRVSPLVGRDPQIIARDVTVLRAAARAIVALGGSRRRGEGWVTVTDGQEWTDADSQVLLSLKAAAS